MSNALRPLFVTVTWGAGGCTSSRSLELAELCQRQLGLTTCLHLTCTNMKRKIVDEALEEAKAMGVRNILALRGDPPREDEYRLEGVDDNEEEDSNADFTWAIDLVRYIKRVHGDYFCVGVAGYPEGHADESYPTEQSSEHDLPYLVEKTKAGADFIMTQLFYDLNAYTKYERMLREHESGVFADIPIIPGLMPIQSYAILKRTAKLSHAKLPPELLARLETVKGDDEAVKSVGVDAISEVIEGIKDVKAKGPRGFHFYTLNLEKAVGSILEKCQLIPNPPNLNELDVSAIDEKHFLPNGISSNHSNSDGATSPLAVPARRLSSTATSDNHLTTSPPSHSYRSTSPSRATDLAKNQNSREATWDDYPNGRFGDARSPAFDAPLTYSPTSLSVSPAHARALWGEPTSPTDITNLFASHLSGSRPTQLPWSESATLSPETALIVPHLLTLTQQKSYWTIASQPAVDGLPSTNPTHGWGPAGGFIFQKAFVEFFLPLADFHAHLKRHLTSPAIRPEVSWYMGTSSGTFESSEPRDAVHAVTWGSFPGKEIVTATMVEEVSFRAWVDEAFGIWSEWARCVRGAGSRRFLRGVREGWCLVNVIAHGYREEGRLWEILRQVLGEGEGGR